jgi:uncharacterized protein (DUF1778 family)
MSEEEEERMTDANDAEKALDRCTRLADEALIPARLVLSNEAFDRVVELLERSRAPTEALCALMRGECP